MKKEEQQIFSFMDKKTKEIINLLQHFGNVSKNAALNCTGFEPV